MYSIPYLIVTLILLVLYLIESGKISLFSASTARKIALFVLFVFIGLRGHLYSDFISYYPWYNDLPNIFNLRDAFDLDWRFEPGFVIYSSIVKTIIPNYFGWVAINTLVDILVLRFTFKRYCNSEILPFIFFLAFNGLIIEFNLYRNVKALDLFLLSIPFLQSKKLLPYLLLNLLGCAFHMSSILYIPLYFILNMRISKGVAWWGIVIANLMFWGGVHIVGSIMNSLSIVRAVSILDAIEGYAEDGEMYKFSIGYFERTFAVVLFTSLYDRLVNQQKVNAVIYNCFWFYYIFFLIFYEVPVFVQRVPMLFMFGYWILYPNVLNIRFKWRPVVVIVISFLIAAKIMMSNSNIDAKYQNVLTGIDTYERRVSEVEPLLK